MSEKASEIMRMSAQEIFKFKIIDEIIPEPKGGAHRNWDEASFNLKKAILNHLTELNLMSEKQIIDQRNEKFRHMGDFALAKIKG